MAVSACLKRCGYLCGMLAVVNILFWIGITIFNAMGRPPVIYDIFKKLTGNRWMDSELLLNLSLTNDDRAERIFGEWKQTEDMQRLINDRTDILNCLTLNFTCFTIWLLNWCVSS